MDEGKAGYDDPLGIYLNTLNFDAHRIVVLPADFDGDGIMPAVQEWTQPLVAVYGGRATERAVRLRANAVSQIAAAGQLPTFEPLLAELWSAFGALVAAAIAAPLESMDEGYHRARTMPLYDHSVRVRNAIHRLHAVWPAVHPPEAPQLNSDEVWGQLRAGVSELATQSRMLRAAKFNIYRQIFPWFGPAMLAADYDPQNETPAVLANWQRANSEWQQFTNLPVLAGPHDWLAAGVAAGMTLAEAKAAPVKELIEAVTVWAVAHRAKMPPVTMPRFATCPTCGKPAPIDEHDSLRCPDCSDRRGTFGELWIDLKTGGRLAGESAVDETHSKLRAILRQRFGEFDANALSKLCDWLVDSHNFTREQVQVAKLTRIVELLQADNAPSAKVDGQSFPTFITVPAGNSHGAREKRFHVTDSLGERVLIVPPNDSCSGDPGPIVLDIEAHTNTRLREGENPVWFIRLHTDFKNHRDPVATISFADFCTRRHASKVDIVGPPAASSPTPPVPVDLLTTDELATLAGVGKPRLLTVFSSARTAGESDLPEPAIRGSGSRGDQYSYTAIRAFLSRKWPARAGAGLFPEAVADVKAWLRKQAA